MTSRPIRPPSPPPADDTRVPSPIRPASPLAPNTSPVRPDFPPHHLLFFFFSSLPAPLHLRVCCTPPPKFSSSPPPLLWAPALLLSLHLLRQFLRPSRPQPNRLLSRRPLRPYPRPFLRTPSLLPRRHFLLMPLLRRRKLLPSRPLLLRKVLPALLNRVSLTCCVRELHLKSSL